MPRFPVALHAATAHQQHHIEGLSMFPLQFRFVPINAGTFFSFQIDNEGIFIFLAPFELALLWPWVKA